VPGSPGLTHLPVYRTQYGQRLSPRSPRSPRESPRAHRGALARLRGILTDKTTLRALILVTVVLFLVVQVVVLLVWHLVRTDVRPVVDSNEAPRQCRYRMGMRLVADDRGRLCPWEMDGLWLQNGCCNASLPDCHLLCQRTKDYKWCCSEFEPCVACCQRRHSFDHCLKSCKTNSATVAGIVYKSELVHCFAER
jgi:hypothetical protein